MPHPRLPSPRQLHLVDAGPLDLPPDFELVILDTGPGTTLGPGFARDLAVYGYEELELGYAIAFVTGESGLVAGESGSGKTRLLTHSLRALGLSVFSTNMAFASMLEDFTGLPDMKAFEQGRVAFLEAENTPWGKNAVVLNELNRSAPALGCKVLDLVDEHSMLGVTIESLRYVFATCNLQDVGVQPISRALLSRFGVLLRSRPLHALEPADQVRVIETMGENSARMSFGRDADDQGWVQGREKLESIIYHGRAQLPVTLEQHGPALTRYVQEFLQRSRQALGAQPLSGRRLGKIRRNLATALALHEAGVRWHDDPYDALYTALCCSVPQVVTDPTFDPEVLAAPHAGAWQASFGRRGSPRAPAPDCWDPATGSGSWQHYVANLGQLSEEQHGVFLGSLFGCTQRGDVDQRVRAIAEGLLVVRTLLGRNDVPPVIVARALGWADRVLGVGSGPVGGAFAELAEAVTDLGEAIDPPTAMALRLALEASRRHHPGGRSEPDVQRAGQVLYEAREAAHLLLHGERSHEGGVACR